MKAELLKSTKTVVRIKFLCHRHGIMRGRSRRISDACSIDTKLSREVTGRSNHFIVGNKAAAQTQNGPRLCRPRSSLQLFR